jgi:HPt (histidine-containing phosphotransfer) domain-containing protein
MDGLLTKPLQPRRLREILDLHGLGDPRAAARDATGSQPPCARAPALDIERLQTLVGDDPQFMAELCRTFMASSTRLIVDLRQAIAAQDRTQLKALAHKLKGGAGSVCARRITDLSLALEHTAMVESFTELAGMVEQIQATLDECASAIEVHFP